MDGIDFGLELAFQSALYVDYRQTRHIIAQPDKYHENNAMLGKHPSLSRTKNYFIGAAIGHWAISELLPQGPYRRAWQAATLVIEANTIIVNVNLGLKF
jgi:hypothetical protein